MATHQLAIAKAAFSAGLLRPDPTSISRDGIAHFHSLLNSAVLKCTPINIQKCKQWILENITQSTARLTALGKYITALAASFTENGVFLDPSSNREPSIKRKRLHLLYLMSDVLHHTKYRINDASIPNKLQPILMSLFGCAASFKECPKHQKKILELLELWEDNGYYSKDYIDKLREAIKNASEIGAHLSGTSGVDDQIAAAKTTKASPFIMPAMHGDLATPWFDLPAGNLMPHIIPNSTRPINPDRIKPLRFVAGPADEGLILAVKGLLDDVEKIFGGEADQDDKLTWDIDELGQPIILDEITGDVLEGEGYYGWSRSFCEKMKRRRNGGDMQDDSRGRERSRTGSSSPENKRRRYSGSDIGSSPADHRSYKARRYDSSRSASRSLSPGENHSRNRSRSQNRSYSPQQSPRRPRQESPLNEGGLNPTAQERQYNLPQKPPMYLNQSTTFQNAFNGNIPPPPPNLPGHNMPYTLPQNVPYPMPHIIPNNMAYNGGAQSQQTGQGSWAPPPPPLHTFPGSQWPPPPPPGPPPFQQQPNFPPSGPGGWAPQIQHNGRGFNNNGWNGSQGRGGRGGRGRGW